MKDLVLGLFLAGILLSWVGCWYLMLREILDPETQEEMPSHMRAALEQLTETLQGRVMLVFIFGAAAAVQWPGILLEAAETTWRDWRHKEIP